MAYGDAINTRTTKEHDMQTFTAALKTIDAGITSVVIEAWATEAGGLRGIIWHRAEDDAAAGEWGAELADFIADEGEDHDDMLGRLRQADWLPAEWIHYDLGGDEGDTIAATR